MREIEDPFVRARGLEQHRARAIAEQHTRCAIRVIQNGSHGIAADDQHFPVRARADELRSDGQRVGKAGTRRGQVKAPGLFRANALLNQASGGGEKHVRGNRGKHDKVDLRGICFGFGQQSLGGFCGHVRGGRALRRDVAFPDPGARADLHDFLQIRVGHHLWRNVTGYTRNFCRNAVGHDAPVLFATPNKEAEFYAIAPGRYKVKTCAA